ncbi:fungal-specific transcription factor domain-containing protein [Pilobolus umbonatus]|nr:fungal-specific transcription factor domain-containing protein [Pilobolus umbonatus]
MEKILDDFIDEDEPAQRKKLKASHEESPNKATNNQNSTNDSDVPPTPLTGAPSGVSPKSPESSCMMSAMRTRYIGDMSPLPFLAQKINFEDARIASQIGVKIRRFGQSLVLCEEESKRSSLNMLEKLGMLKPGETIKGINDWIYKVAGVDKITSDNLLKVYFAYIHPGLPVVNKHVFLKQYRGQIDEYPSAPLLNAIFGAATRYIATCHLFGDKVVNDKIEMKKGWSEKFFDNLIVYVKGDYTPCINTVQAIVIGQSHRASLDEKMTSGWLLNSAAQDLGLHRSSDNWDIPDSEKETRKRVWWSVYIMDKWSSAATGRPQTIFDEDCDEGYPSETASWEEVMDVIPTDNDDTRFPSLDKNVAQKAKSEKIPIYQPFVQLVKLSEILGKILQGLYTPLAKKHSEKRGSVAIVTYLDNALSEWRTELPPALKISAMNVRRLDSRGQTPLLSMSEGGEKTRSSQSSLSICTSAATRCVDIAEKMHYRDFLLSSWNFAIYPVFTASLIHIYNASNSDSIVSDVAKGNLIKATQVVKRLSKLSTAAGRVYEVLLQLMKVRRISVTGEEEVKKTHRRKKSGSIKKTDEDIPANKESDIQSPITIASDSDIMPSAQSTPSSMNGDWINGLYSSFQSDSMPQISPLPSSANSVDEPYTIKQFGLMVHPNPTSDEETYRNTQLRPPLNYNTNNNNNNTMTISSDPMPHPLNPTDSFLLGLSDMNFGMPLSDSMVHQSIHPIQSPDMVIYNPIVNSDNNSSNSNNTSMNNYEVPSMMPMDRMFRNRPDNPFWSVPSSIEWDDWTAYLLPQQHMIPSSSSNPAPTPSWDANSNHWR